MHVMLTYLGTGPYVDTGILVDGSLFPWGKESLNSQKKKIYILMKNLHNNPTCNMQFDWLEQTQLYLNNYDKKKLLTREQPYILKLKFTLRDSVPYLRCYFFFSWNLGVNNWELGSHHIRGQGHFYSLREVLVVFTVKHNFNFMQI